MVFFYMHMTSIYPAKANSTHNMYTHAHTHTLTHTLSLSLALSLSLSLSLSFFLSFSLFLNLYIHMLMHSHTSIKAIASLPKSPLLVTLELAPRLSSAIDATIAVHHPGRS